MKKVKTKKTLIGMPSAEMDELRMISEKTGVSMARIIRDALKKAGVIK